MDLSRRMKVNHGTISMWLSGQRNPSAKSVRKLAQALGVDEDVALIAAGHKSPDPYLEPDSPETRLLPLIRKVEWTEDRLDATEFYFRAYIAADERRRQREQKE